MAVQKSSVGSYSTNKRDEIREAIRSAASQYFKSTLGQEPDLANIVTALFLYESSLNPNALGSPISYSRSGGIGYQYLNSPEVTKVRTQINSSPPTDSNMAKLGFIMDGLRAVGLGQVMGLYYIKTTSSGSGLKQLRPDVPVPQFEPGTDFIPQVTGAVNVNTAILACLVILESKWKSAKMFSDGWGFGSANWVRFPSRISAAVGAYLGLAKQGDLNGTTADVYSASIVGGAAYREANGNSPSIKEWTTASASSPTTNSSGKQTVVPAGCA